MKHPIHRAFSILGALVILIQVTGCNLLRSGTDEYNDLVSLVQGVQSAASNFQLVTDTQYAKIQAKTQITKDYYDAVSNSGEVWTGNFRSEQEILNELLRKYRDANGQPLDPTQLNLDALQVDTFHTLSRGYGAGTIQGNADTGMGQRTCASCPEITCVKPCDSNDQNTCMGTCNTCASCPEISCVKACPS
jgi:hypothetical protein